MVVAGLATAILLVFAVSASANFLRKGRAAEANRSYTQGYCDGTGSPDCSEWHSGPCTRVSRRRVDCNSSTDGNYSCQWKNRWTLHKGSNRLHHEVTDRFCII